jgi:hypothetical protein
MPVFKLVAEHQSDDGQIESRVTHEFDVETLSEVMMHLDMFVRGVGFVYDGEVGILNEAEYDDDTIRAFSDIENLMHKRDECCGGCNTKEEKTTHSDHFWDIDRNR